MTIWLASFPRSGNTFLRIVMKSVFGIDSRSIYDDEADIGKNTALTNLTGHKKLASDWEVTSTAHEQEYFLIKTHDLPPNETDKAIYIVRDGRESCVSYAEYLKNFNDEKKSFTDIAIGNSRFGRWADSVQAWTQRSQDTTLIIRFEDLVKQPILQIDNIAEFLGLVPTEKVVPTFQELKEVDPLFFQSGKTSSWKKRITPAEHLLFWLFNHEQMLKLGYTSSQPILLRSKTVRATGKILSLFTDSLFENEKNYLNRILERHEVVHNRNKMISSRDHQIDEIKQLLKNKQEAIEDKQRIINLKVTREEYLLKILRDKESVEQELGTSNKANIQYQNKIAQMEDLILEKQSNIEQKQKIIDQKIERETYFQEIAAAQQRLQKEIEEARQQDMVKSKRIQELLALIEARENTLDTSTSSDEPGLSGSDNSDA